MKTTSLARIAPAAAIALALAGAGAALAKEKTGDDVANLAGTKLSITQAIDAAQKVDGGNVVSADLDKEKGVVGYKVEILLDGVEHKAFVNGQTGEVVKGAVGENDKADHEDSEDGDEND